MRLFANSCLGLRLLDFRAVRKGTLRGLCSVRLAAGVTINDITVGESNGKQWALLPSKPMIDRDGNLLRDAGSMISYAPVVEWGIPALRDEFSQSGAALAHLARADVFDAEGP